MDENDDGVDDDSWIEVGQVLHGVLNQRMRLVGYQLGSTEPGRLDWPPWPVQKRNTIFGLAFINIIII